MLSTYPNKRSRARASVIAVTALATLCLSGHEGRAEDREIPVRASAGTLRKNGAPSTIQAGKGSAGVLKRKKAGKKLDPDYDPAAADRAMADAPAAPAAPPARTEAQQAQADKAVEDWVQVKGNFPIALKCMRLPLNARVTMDFEDVPLESMVKLISCWLDRNFLIASNKRGAKITILSPHAVSVYEAYRAFLSALHVNGMTVTQKGRFYHIVDSGEARSSGAVIVGPDGKVPDEDRIITRIVRLDHVDAKDVEPLITKFKSKTGDLFIYQPNNTLILTDSGTNIRRILELLKDVDVPLGKEKIWIRPVQHMAAAELVERITAVFGDKGTTSGSAAAGRTRGRASRAKAAAAATANASADAQSDPTRVKITKIIADERTNQLIMITTRASYLKIDALIRRLDVPIPGEGQIHIHHLENADAEELSSTLSSLAGGSRGAARPARGGTAAKGAGGSAALFEGDVKITAYKPTNSLVIEASLKDYLSLSKVISQLDRRRKQVYVEAVIMEISTAKNRNMQIAGSAGYEFDIGGEAVPLLVGLGGMGIGGVDVGQLSSGGIAAGLQGPLVQANTGSAAAAAGATLSIPAFGFLLQAIQENSDVNILSTPHILTLNNEEAEIQVGRKVPYRSASLGGSGGLSGLAGLSGLSGLAGGGSSGLLGALGGLGGLGGSMVQHVDVDLTLKITPQINESDFIKLKIDEQLDEIEAMDPNLGPTTSKRKVTNTVVVRDQQPVVIGGLVTDRETTGVAKIPVLGDLPLIGIFFRKSTKRMEKKNLLLIIVPHIIKDPSDIRRVHEEKQRQLHDFAEELATRHKEYAGKIDFRKKSGLMQRIYHAVEETADERRLIEKAYFDNSDVDMVGPAEQHDLDYDPTGGADNEEGGAGQGSDPGVHVIELPDAAETQPDQGTAKRPAAAKGGETREKRPSKDADGADTSTPNEAGR